MKFIRSQMMNKSNGNAANALIKASHVKFMSAKCQHDYITQNRLPGELILELLVIYVWEYRIYNKLLPQQT